MSKTALSFTGVTRTFGTGAGSRVVVDDLDLHVNHGEVLCLLGPNGAGKTTSIKMAATLLEPASGSVTIDGVDAVRFPREARNRSGLVLGGDRGFYMRASARENLKFFGELQGVSGRRLNGRIEAVLNTVGLFDRRRDKVESFSRGMRQRLHIARALVNEPSLVLLDEPSIGLDPEAARDLRNLASSLRESGCGILLTTHYMAEAEELADRLVILDSGRVVAEGTASDIARAAGTFAVTSYRADMFTSESDAALTNRADVLSVLVRAGSGSSFVDVTWSTPVADPESIAAVRSYLQGGETVGSRNATLEEAYIAFLNSRRIAQVAK